MQNVPQTPASSVSPAFCPYLHRGIWCHHLRPKCSFESHGIAEIFYVDALMSLGASSPRTKQIVPRPMAQRPRKNNRKKKRPSCLRMPLPIKQCRPSHAGHRWLEHWPYNIRVHAAHKSGTRGGGRGKAEEPAPCRAVVHIAAVFFRGNFHQTISLSEFSLLPNLTMGEIFRKVSKGPKLMHIQAAPPKAPRFGDAE